MQTIIVYPKAIHISKLYLQPTCSYMFQNDNVTLSTCKQSIFTQKLYIS